MTIEEAKKALKERSVVIYKGHEHFIDHIQTYYDKGFRNALFLVPCNGINSATVARMADCVLRGG